MTMSVLRVRQIVVGAVAVHSLLLGSVMLVCPGRVLGLTGWTCEGSLFFPSQSGLFLLILGGGYAAGVWHRPFAWFIVGSKVAAVVFLVAEHLLGNAPALLLPVASVDGVMGAAVAVVVWRERRWLNDAPGRLSPTVGPLGWTPAASDETAE